MPGSAGKDRSSARLTGGRPPRLGVAIAATCAVLLVCGCSLNYEEATLEEQSAGGIPDTVANGVIHRVNKEGRLSLQMEASRAETYNSTNTTVLTNAHFVEYDSSGGKATEGSAQRVVYHSDTENAEISGSVRVHSASEKGSVSAESLSWVNKEKRLSAPPDESVFIRKDDGSFISGVGFTGDFHTRQVAFSGPVKGSYVWEEKK
jgi:LPS export ABC transporter protein LptC